MVKRFLGGTRTERVAHRMGIIKLEPKLEPAPAFRRPRRRSPSHGDAPEASRRELGNMSINGRSPTVTTSLWQDAPLRDRSGACHLSCPRSPRREPPAGRARSGVWDRAGFDAARPPGLPGRRDRSERTDVAGITTEARRRTGNRGGRRATGGKAGQVPGRGPIAPLRARFRRCERTWSSSTVSPTTPPITRFACSALGMIRGRVHRLEMLRHVARVVRPGGRLLVHAHNRWAALHEPGGIRRLAGSWIRSRISGDHEFGDATYSTGGWNRCPTISRRRGISVDRLRARR